MESFYDQLAVFGCVPKRSFIIHRDKDGNADGIYQLAIGISNNVGVYLSTEHGHRESEEELENDITKLCLLLSQSLESLWTKHGKKDSGGIPDFGARRYGQRGL
jgi:hypothetical protein